MTTTKRIAMLPVAARRAVLDNVSAVTKGRYVVVEYAYDRQLAGATKILGELLGTAFMPGGGSADVLIVNPVSGRHRTHALPAAQVLRIRLATAAMEPQDNTERDVFNQLYRVGPVLAGPSD